MNNRSYSYNLPEPKLISTEFTGSPIQRESPQDTELAGSCPTQERFGFYESKKKLVRKIKFNFQENKIKISDVNPNQ